MKAKKSIFNLSLLTILALMLLQSCDKNDSSFVEDHQLQMLPTEISYPDILDVREYGYAESAVPFMNTNGHPVTFELASIRKGDKMLDETFLNSVDIVNYSLVESTVIDRGDRENPIEYTIYTDDLTEMGKVIIEDENPFDNGEYFFTFKVSSDVNGVSDSRIYEDALRLYIGPSLSAGIAYCPFNMNFVSAESTVSNPVDVIGGNDDIRFELGSESDKLYIDPLTGVISVNPSYSISETEVLKPIINVVSNISEEVSGFEETFTATLSTTPVELDKEKNYFFFPNLIPYSQDNLAAGGDGWSRQIVESHSDDDGWYNPKAVWQARTPPVNTSDALAVQAESGVKWTQRLQIPLWTMTKPHDSWVVMDSQNLVLFEGCFDSKAVFWYAIYMNEIQSGYEEDGSTPIDLEVHITNNYTGDVTTTDWTQVNDILECEINHNGTIFKGTPYPGDQTGADPEGRKDPSNSPNKLWVRGELNLEDYKTQENFTIAFRFKTYYETEPYHKNTNGVPAVNGWVRVSNVHFLASEK